MSVAQSQNYQSIRLIVVMGTTGCGKSTVGSALSRSLDAPHLEGDDYHSRENKQKMSAGTALTDIDRWPWLQSIGEAMRDSSGKVVASCSSLKRSYRDYLTETAGEKVLFVYLHGSKETLANRLAARQDHFMSADLLDSQLATLEVPASEEFSLTVNIDNTVAQIVDQIVQRIT